MIHRKRELGAASQQHLQRTGRVEDIILCAVLFWNQKRLPCTQHKFGGVCCFFFPPFLFFLLCWSFRGGIKTWSKRQETRTSTEDSPARRGVLFRCEAVQTQGDHRGTGFFGRLAAPFFFVVPSWCFSRWRFEHIFLFLPIFGEMIQI